MPETLTISTAKPVDVALDYEALRGLAISHIEQTASALWTDYNVHDPGITTLELLCYALTDLAYRTQHNIPDLLAAEDGNRQTVIDHFFTARQILPNRAVTVSDYRKLLIGIEGVKNAWLVQRTKTVFADWKEKKLVRTPPAANPFEPVAVKGFYDVLLEFDLNVTTDQEKQVIIDEAKRTLLQNRNLCEDFLSVNEIPRQSFRLCAEMELAPSADVHRTLAQIFLNIQLFLNPLVRFYSLEEMRQSGLPVDQIFEGPLLPKGFIRNEELDAAGLRIEIHLSDVMQQILNVEGVRNITDIILQPSAQLTPLANKWIIPVRAGFQPVLETLGSKILFTKNGMPVRPDMSRVETLYHELFDAVYTGNEAKTSGDVLFDTGRFVAAGAYTSIQHHFPKNYGIGHWGLPSDATALRKTQAAQLKGYLWVFDQLLAGYLAQLANLRQLFSTDAQTKTLFTQVVRDFPGAEALFADAANIETAVQAAAEDNALFVQRRNRFLNHLLSRFAESFFDYVSVLQSAFPGTDPAQVIGAKAAFLKDYPAYSSNRFGAYDYAEAEGIWDTENTSGLEKRLQRLLGMESTQRRSLVNTYREILDETSLDGTIFRYEIHDNRTGDLLLQSTTPFTSREACSNELENLFDTAVAESRYQIEKRGEKKFVYQLLSGDNVIAAGLQQFTTRKAAEDAILQILGLLTTQSEEGLFLVEHLLLFPSEGEAFLPICVDADCRDCSDKDPYSFRVSVVLPAYAPRFRQMDFRRYVERVIRTEMPAHLFPKICWVSNEQLREFEKAYRDWLAVKAGTVDDTIDGTILQAFITVLTSLKTVYPVTRLQDCAAGEERQLFLLDQNALGTLKS